MAAPPMPGDSAIKKIARSPQDFDLSNMSEAQLIEMRGMIDRLLPTTRLKDLNLEKELVLQLVTIQGVQADALDNDEVPAHQKAQVAGKVADALATLGKLQIEVYSSERLKKVEAVLIGVLKNLPHAQQDEFLTAYEEAVGAMS